MKVSTKTLPKSIQEMIRGIRIPGAPGGKSVKPREVVVEFQAGPVVKICRSYNALAVAGTEQLAVGPVEYWTGSDGEPNSDRTDTYGGPVVEVVRRYTPSRAEVRLVLATGLSDEHAIDADGSYIESPHRRFVAATAEKLATDPAFLSVLIDAAFERVAFPFPALPATLKACVDCGEPQHRGMFHVCRPVESEQARMMRELGAA